MEQVISWKNLFVEYFLLTFVILWSGCVFTFGYFNNWPYIMFVVAMAIIIKRNQRIEKKNWLAIGAFLLVLLFQTVLFSGPMTSIIQPFISILSLAMIAVVVRPNLNHVFIMIMAVIAFIGLVFWIIDIFPVGHDVLLNIAKKLPQMGGDVLNEQEGSAWSIFQEYTLYFYNVSDISGEDGFYTFARNSGPFFEPGRFTLFLTIAMALILYGGMYKKYRFVFYLLLVANVTTFSTTGYLAMIVLLSCYFLGHSHKSRISKLFILFMLYVVANYVFRLSFMEEKVVEAVGETDVANTRFGAMFYHMTQIANSPWIGYGVFLDDSLLEMSPCGITDMMRKWGIPVFVLVVLLLNRSTRSYLVDNKLYKISFVLILLILAYSQTVMDAPLYYLFYFIGSEKYEYINESQV